jgi:hypothetical protein
MSSEMRNAIPAEYLNKFEHVPAELLEKEEQDPDALIVPNTKAALQASVKALTSQLQAGTKERDDARAALLRTKQLMRALERSYGLAAASVVPVIPVDEPTDVLRTFESLRGEEASRFYRENQAAIIAAQNRRQYGNQK